MGPTGYATDMKTEVLGHTLGETVRALAITLTKSEKTGIFDKFWGNLRPTDRESWVINHQGIAARA